LAWLAALTPHEREVIDAVDAAFPDAEWIPVPVSPAATVPRLDRPEDRRRRPIR
jgi:hypothetical protein